MEQVYFQNNVFVKVDTSPSTAPKPPSKFTKLAAILWAVLSTIFVPELRYIFFPHERIKQIILPKPADKSASTASNNLSFKTKKNSETIRSVTQMITDSEGVPVEGATILCPTCIIKNVTTDNNGLYTLQKEFKPDDPFPSAPITVSNNENRSENYIQDFLSPEALKF